MSIQSVLFLKSKFSEEKAKKIMNEKKIPWIAFDDNATSWVFRVKINDPEKYSTYAQTARSGIRIIRRVGKKTRFTGKRGKKK